MNINAILNVDSYKCSHKWQYPANTEYISSYVESRGGRWDKTLFFGLQIFIKEYLTKPITLEDINEAEEFLSAHREPFYKEGWEYILNTYNGYLPIKIEAIPEGLVVPNRNVLVQVVNTDPKCYWLTTYIETAILRAIWYPSTAATNSLMCRKLIYDSLEKTADNPDEEIGFKLHDFGARGVSSFESASIGGAAHLINFLGTDTISGVLAARKYYDEPMAGFSIPAAEHSTITSWGGPEKEIEAFRNMLKQFAKPDSMVAVVSDSYDIHNACNNLWGDKLKQEVLDSGALLIVRPDSGNPLTVPIRVIQELMEHYGYYINNKGYKVLNDSIRVIQGDGINHDSLKQILDNIENAKLSTSNIAFGMGGGLLQELNRDTLKFAMKCSAIYINGKWQDVYKDPTEDIGKSSKRGILALKLSSGLGSTCYQTVRIEQLSNLKQNLLRTVYKNGKIYNTSTFQQIRDRAKK